MDVERVLAQLVGCAYEGAGHREAVEALQVLGLYEREVLLAAALHVDTISPDVREGVYDLIAGAIGSLRDVSA